MTRVENSVTASRKRTNTERRQASRDRILTAAEELFATGGYNGVSMKQIADAAKVDTSLMHYYFSTKEGLFGAVAARRADAVNEVRLTALKRYADEAGDRITVEGLLRAYLEPTFAYVRRGGESLRHYLAIIAQLNSTQANAVPGLNGSPFDPAVREFIALLQRAAPHRTAAEVHWFYHMLSGAISLTWARTGRLDALSDGLCRSDDFDTACREMIAVFARGLDVREAPEAASLA